MTTHVVTAHSGGGSMGEGMQPAVAVLCPDKPQADALAADLQKRLDRADQYGDWLTMATPLVDLASFDPAAWVEQMLDR